MNDSGKILIVEDENVTALSIESILESKGFRVCGKADSGKKALELVQSKNPDLVLMDIDLKTPTNDGIESALCMKEQYGVSVIFLACHYDRSIFDKLEQIEPLGCIIKPFDNYDLITAVKLGLHRARIDKTQQTLNRKLIKVINKKTQLLKESDFQFNRLFNAVNDAVWAKDLDGNMLYINTATADVYGRRLSELYEYSDFWIDMIFPADQENVRQKADRLFETGQSQCEYRIVRDDGEVRWLDERTIVIYDDEGNPMQIGSIATDITEKKMIQAEAIRTAHLASLGELAAGVAHEINNPITGIITISEVLADKFHQLGGDRKIPERIVQDAERVAKIVKNLLSFAKGDKEERACVHIRALLKLTLELVERQIAKDGIQLRLHLPEDLPEINASPQELQQVFLNIISNARYALKRKFGNLPDKKVLQINGEHHDLEGKAYLRVTFQDNGVGVPGDMIEKSMEPFFSTKPQGEGTGLGLSISHGIIKNHGGYLRLESKEGQYTKVFVDLPTIFT